MPLTYSDFDWDQVSKEIIIKSPNKIVTIQEIWDNTRRFSSEPGSMPFTSIMRITGKETLSATKKIGLTLVLQNWLIKFVDRAGPTYDVCKVTDGNILAQTNYPTEPAVYADSPLATSTFVFGTWEADTSAALVDDVRLDRILGLNQENQFIDNTVFDGNNNLTSGRLRIFPTAALASAATDGGTGEGESDIYTITATYSGGNLDTYLVVKS